jgi:hypothetical protein
VKATSSHLNAFINIYSFKQTLRYVHSPFWVKKEYTYYKNLNKNKNYLKAQNHRKKLTQVYLATKNEALKERYILHQRLLIQKKNFPNLFLVKQIPLP